MILTSLRMCSFHVISVNFAMLTDYKPRNCTLAESLNSSNICWGVVFLFCFFSSRYHSLFRNGIKAVGGIKLECLREGLQNNVYIADLNFYFTQLPLVTFPFYRLPRFKFL